MLNLSNRSRPCVLIEPIKTHRDLGEALECRHGRVGRKAFRAAGGLRGCSNDAMSTALPEQRLAKIFAAMSPKDAAKVMDQMPDTDVRSILALMSDRSAAAVLSQFTPARAATITKGASRATGNTP